MRELDRETDIDERAQHAHLIELGRLEQLRERRAGELLHHEERQVVGVAADLVNRHDRRVFEAALH